MLRTTFACCGLELTFLRTRFFWGVGAWLEGLRSAMIRKSILTPSTKITLKTNKKSVQVRPVKNDVRMLFIKKV